MEPIEATTRLLMADINTFIGLANAAAVDGEYSADITRKAYYQGLENAYRKAVDILQNDIDLLRKD